ncbi:alanine--tRNA ligase-related protein [Vibrio viridaestus]|uniref:Alanyl-tRNA editing protein n=1 Tax=Vibrio viridaestus TaxID=2487322 RepID=A0A3N9U5N8_9VIBR|nr:alanyl-tRNA editing protein [Vibrio viridaestus]RQW63366.1 alanyl-tRNA editing protein [Vibrio viridaestus]
MTAHKVFWDDPYLTELTSRVTGVDGNNITLSDTIFYAESGGQESDAGTIGNIEVLKAQKDGLDIIYTLASAPDFSVGDDVVTRIDWQRRHALMKLHFAAEVILELLTQRYPNIVKIGAHISQDKSRIDFEWPESISPLLPKLEEEAHSLIHADSPIECDFSDEQAQRRYWKVDSFAQVPCGGTHLKRTSEVGNIRLKRKNIGKGKERVEISLSE